MFALALIGYYFNYMDLYVKSETLSPEYSNLAFLINIFGMIIFMWVFSRNGKYTIQNLSSGSKNKNKLPLYLFYIFVLFYWIPVFLYAGYSPYDRGAWRSQNSWLYLEHTVWLILPISLTAIISTTKKYERYLIILITIILIIGIGEKFTGLIMILPVLFLEKTIRNKISLLLIIAIGILAFKAIGYYGLNISEGSDNALIMIAIANRLVNEVGLINTIVNLDMSYRIFNNINFIIPYQEWGKTDKPLIMSEASTVDVWIMAKESGGLITGTIVASAYYLFGPILGILYIYVIARIGAALLNKIFEFLTSKSHFYVLIGIMGMIIFETKYMPIIHSGFVSSIFKIDLILLMIICIVASVLKIKIK